MKFALLLGTVCIIGSVAAQRYESQQRPSGFTSSGAAAIEPVRIRTRGRASSQEQQTTVGRQAVQQTTPQPARPRGRVVARARDISQEEPQRQQARQRISAESDEVYSRPRVQVQTPVATQPPQPQTTRLVTPKPVVEEEDGDYISEEVEDEGEAGPPNSISRSAYVGPFNPSLSQASLQNVRPIQPIQPIQTPPSFPRPAFLQPTAFRPSPPVFPPQNIQQPQALPNSQPLGVVKQAPRPQPLPQLRPQPQPSRPPVAPTPAYNSFSSEEEDEDEEPQYVRQPPSRQQAKRPQGNDVDAFRQPSKPQPPRQQQIVRSQDTSRPYPSKPSQVQKDRKPVVQTVRKYHDENEDGSITWGYENDDGTFKEETIGNDCVTRGKYGYVDPDGVKREYTYQTGIPCDKEAEAEIAASSNEGYIDYTNNRYVFPNGDEIDLDEMVKNRARKPAGKFRY